MFTITRIENGDLSKDEIAAIVSLTFSIWPKAETTEAALAATFLERHRQYMASYPGKLRPSVRHLAWEGDKFVGHAYTFDRPVIGDGRVMSVMALSGVSVAPSFRGRGLGKALVLSAFQRVSNGEFPVSLFQTPVPEFYRRLGATEVRNQFFDSRNQENPEARPWSDDWVMIYPQGVAWPSGPIDLNGPGY